MILATTYPCKVGEIFTPTEIYHGGEFVQPQPIRIVREASVEEWHNYTAGMGLVPFLDPRYKYFYEVSTD